MIDVIRNFTHDSLGDIMDNFNFLVNDIDIKTLPKHLKNIWGCNCYKKDYDCLYECNQLCRAKFSFMLAKKRKRIFNFIQKEILKHICW